MQQEQVKQDVHRLRDAVANTLGIKIKLAQAYELYAQTKGYANWDTASVYLVSKDEGCATVEAPSAPVSRPRLSCVIVSAAQIQNPRQRAHIISIAARQDPDRIWIVGSEFELRTLRGTDNADALMRSIGIVLMMTTGNPVVESPLDSFVDMRSLVKKTCNVRVRLADLVGADNGRTAKAVQKLDPDAVWLEVREEVLTNDNAYVRYIANRYSKEGVRCTVSTEPPPDDEDWVTVG